MFNSGILIQSLTESKQRHEMAAKDLAGKIVQVESTLQEMGDMYERHMGAAQANGETLEMIKSMMRIPVGTPANDPNAESD